MRRLDEEKPSVADELRPMPEEKTSVAEELRSVPEVKVADGIPRTAERHIKSVWHAY